MLGRASGPRLPLAIQSPKYLQTSYNELYLPWLCPSFYTSSTRSHSSSTLGRQRTTARPTPTKPRPVDNHESTSRSFRRGLATPIPDIYSQPSEDFIPFVNGPPSLGSPHESLVERPKPLILDVSCITSAAAFRSSNGISGELDEIHQTLHACLQVGRLERAAVLVQRLNKLYKPTAPGLLDAHTQYISELAWRITRTKDQQMFKRLQNWFAYDVLRKGIRPDAMMYALMIQACLSGDNRETMIWRIRRYSHLAEEGGVHRETLALVQTLLEEDQVETFEEFAKNSPQCIEVAEVAPPSADVLHAATTSLPEVSAVPQKGLGLSSLRNALSTFRDTTSGLPSEEGSSDQLDSNATQNLLRQRRLENDTYESAIGRWRQESAKAAKLGAASVLHAKSIGVLMWEWHEALVPAIKEEVRKANEAEGKSTMTKSDKDSCEYGPFLRLLSPEKISAATILAATTLMATERGARDGMKLVNLVMNIGKRIQDESLSEAMLAVSQRIRKKVRGGTEFLKSPAAKQRMLLNSCTVHPEKRNPELLLGLQAMHPEKSKSELIEGLQWSRRIQIKVGSVLLSRLIEAANLDVESTREGVIHTKERQPAFFHSFRYITGKRCGFVQLNKAMFEKLAREPVESVPLKNLPMVVEPKPWTGYRDGGYLEYYAPVLRIREGGLGKRYGIVASDNGDMDQSFAGLTVLGKTPWRINRPVLEALIEAWNTGDAIAKIPALDPVVERPPEPSNTAATDHGMQRFRWLRHMKAIENRNFGMKCNRCFQNFQVEIARAYVDQTFYFPHNLDFRGRAYPISPLFNHMGADNVRGLLIFAKGKELGVTGLRWLKIHLANVYGFDKASFAEREKFADEHLIDVYDAAENPLNGRRWWLKGEDPWQCLATCIELKNALESEDPQRFVSHLPIHQDGTCNGLQHYAALGGDVLGAKQVNLEPGDRPSDIYTGVAELVKAQISKDAAHGNATAKALDGIVTRKVVKQTVMTNVYGVTFLGATRQVRKQLTAIFPSSEVPPPIMNERAQYVTRKIFDALSTMFTGAHDIQYWLGNCANRITQSLSPEQIDFILAEKPVVPGNADCKRLPTSRKSVQGPTAFKTPVIWTNPLRMPVVQPYRKGAAEEVFTNLQSISIRRQSPSEAVSKRKQFQAFPPNFIHSLDASHMVLTALMCDAKGLTFAAVHDSFWTHATDVDVMNGFIRDTFIKMHSENIVGRLAAEFSARYKDYIYLASVSASSVVGQKIRAMRKSAGRTQNLTTDTAKLEELRMERLRCKLLVSDDAKEREQGASMVTAASVFEQCADEKELLPSQNLEAGIGEVHSVRATRLEANEQLEVGDPDNSELLDPSTDDSDFDIESQASETEESAAVAEDEKVQPSKAAKRRLSSMTTFWMPMTFPPVPKKGDFDLARLKRSLYFFS